MQPTQRSNSVLARAFLAAMCCAGCGERVVSTRGMLDGLPGAQGGVRPEPQQRSAAPADAPTPTDEWDALLAPYRTPDQRSPGAGLSGAAASGAGADARGAKAGASAPNAPATMREIAPLRMQKPDGSIVLVANSPAHVIYHLTQTLAKNEDQLLLDQVMSDAAKIEYRKRARDPMEGVAWLKEHEQDIARLFAALPLAEHTPGVTMKSIGRNRFRLSLSPDAAQDLKLHELDVIVERGQFRLLMLR